MGQIAIPSSGPVYVETSPFIYYVEQIAPYAAVSQPLWDAVDSGRIEIITADLTLLEVLVKPLQSGNNPLADRYRRILLGTIGIQCVSTNHAIMEQAAALRAGHGLKTPGAIHAATALLARSTLFVSNDPVFRRVPQLNSILLSDIAATP